MSKFQRILFSILNKFEKTFSGKWVKKIPGAKKIYHILGEFPWLLSFKKVVEIEGSKMYLNPWEKPPLRQAFRAYLRCSKEPLTVKMFKEIVREGNTVVDIGANIGYFTLLAAKLVGKNGRVYSFEPEPTNYKFLCKNIQLNGYENVIAYQKAISNKVGKVKLYLACETGAHTLRESHNTSYFINKKCGQFVEVESIVLDDFFANKDCKIDVIKIDVEGSEMLVFLGMERIIRENKNLKIITEFSPSFIREMGYSPEELARKILEDYRFTVTVIDELRSPTFQYIKVNDTSELMNVSEGKDKIVNLFLTR